MKEEPAPAEDSPAPSRNAGRGTLNPAEVEKEIFRIVKNISKYERELTGLEDFRNDLGMDSLSIMEMCTEIESLYSVSVGAFITAIPNARELTDYILDPIFERLAASGRNPAKKANAYLYPLPRKWIHRALFAYFIKDALGSSFLPISRGLIVNVEFIRQLGPKSCLLKDGREQLSERDGAPPDGTKRS